MLRCPECQATPDPLFTWRCAGCEDGFDPFATRGCCPRCAGILLKTRCPACATFSPHEAWYQDPDVREAYLSSDRSTPASSRPLTELRAQVFLAEDALAAADLDARDLLERKLEAAHRACEVANRHALRSEQSGRRLRALGGPVFGPALDRLMGPNGYPFSAPPTPSQPKEPGDGARAFATSTALGAAAERATRDPLGAVEHATLALRVLGRQKASPARSARLMEAYRIRACAYVHLDDYDAALFDAGEAVAACPKDAWSRVIRGELFLWRREWAQAAEDFEQAVSSEPDLVRAYSQLGYVALALGDAQRALWAMRRAACLYPHFPNLFVARAQVHLGLGGDDAARADFDWALELDEGHASGLAWRGALRIAAGDTAGGRNDLDRAAVVDGDDAPEVSLPLRAALTGDASGLEGTPDDETWPHPLGRYFSGRLPAEGLIELVEARSGVTGRDRVSRVRGLLGIEAERLGDGARARAHYEACLAAHGLSGETFWARGRLQPRV